MSTSTQCAAILEYMRTRGSINPMVALREFGCARLAARILNLKEEGYLILTTIVRRNGKRFAAYSLIEGEHRADSLAYTAARARGSETSPALSLNENAPEVVLRGA